MTASAFAPQMDAAFREHWPLPGGLDFAKGGFSVVAAAVEAELRRFHGGEPLAKKTRSFRSMVEVFAAPEMLDNVGLHCFVVPTRSAWVGIWTSTFLCGGYDSLAWCLAQNHGLETVHFHCSENGAWCQPGTVFTHRAKGEERSIAAIQEDRRWIFFQSGQPRPEEDVRRYERRKIRERWNSEALLSLLGRIGIRPWSEDYYDFSVPLLHLERREAPPSIIRMTRQQFRRQLQAKWSNETPGQSGS
jgi:hypothetical protein